MIPVGRESKTRRGSEATRAHLMASVTTSIYYSKPAIIQHYSAEGLICVTHIVSNNDSYSQTAAHTNRTYLNRHVHTKARNRVSGSCLNADNDAFQ